MRTCRLLLVATVLAAGCDRLASLQQSLSTSQADGPVPVTEDECLQFATDLQRAVEADDRPRTAELISLTEPFKIAVRDFEGSPEYRRVLMKHCEEDAARHPFVPLLLAKVRAGGQFKLLRVHVVDGRPRALFRVIRNDGAVGYMDFIPARFPDGKVRLEDLFLPAAAELVSQTVRRIDLELAAEEGHGPPGHPKSKEKVWTNHIPQLNAMHRAMTDGKYADAVATYKALPEPIRTNRSVFLQYVQAALHLADVEYLAALDGFRRQFPKDPALIVQAIDFLRLTRQYDGSVRAITAFEQSIGGDPCLKALRGLVLAKGWRFVDARAAAAKAVEEEPTLKLAYFARIQVSLSETNHPDTLEWLKKLVEATGHKMHNLQADPDYAVFVRSPEYREWLRWLANRKAP